MISMQSLRCAILLLSSCFILMAVQPVLSANVKITPLGSHDGDFYKFDRAMILEDTDGTRFQYDAGMTVTGATDPRLGKIDVLLVSHMLDEAGLSNLSKHPKYLYICY